jgi:hypothetical protein
MIKLISLLAALALQYFCNNEEHCTCNIIDLCSHAQLHLQDS